MNKNGLAEINAACATSVVDSIPITRDIRNMVAASIKPVGQFISANLRMLAYKDHEKIIRNAMADENAIGIKPEIAGIKPRKITIPIK